MNKIIVEVSIGELLDKISILEIKQEKIKDPEKLKFITNEHSILKNQLDKNINLQKFLIYKTLRELIFTKIYYFQKLLMRPGVVQLQLYQITNIKMSLIRIL